MPKENHPELLTVAAIRKTEEAEEILFNERERIFVLSKKLETANEMLAKARELRAKKQPVRVVLNEKAGTIEKLEQSNESEVQDFRKARILVENAAKSVRIDLSKIDPTIFNIAKDRLKWPAFRLCTRIVPNYAKAKEIFDFCAEQSCNLPGPYDISPCIPFQYVLDGCYARAHKMRKVITEKYGYCCEKVFSFANQGTDKLAVKADKWGGCCVTWWYHVAPLIRVKVKLRSWSIELAMVVDPGMFNKPVLLSSWLSAQENTACSPNAHLSMYSIQDGSAYTPANYSGTSFSTDPSYTATDATLTAYQSLQTC